MEDPRRDTGARGEQVAAWFLHQHGLEVVAQNVTTRGGEVDLVARDGARRVVIEVRSTHQEGDPIDRVDPEKRRRVARLAGGLGADRIDFIGIRFDDRGFDVHWVPGA